MPDPTAVRVARRHQAAVVLRDVPLTTRIDFTGDGRISALWLRTTLEAEVGPLWSLQFVASSKGPPITVGWEATTRGGGRISGTLVLRARVTAREVVTWAEVTVASGP